MTAPFDLQSTYVCLEPGGGAASIPVTADFWATIEERSELVEGRLVATFVCDADWSHWEMHPHGEELLVLMSGRLTMVLDEGGRESAVPLTAGQAVLVPRGTWHRAEVHEPGVLLGVTYGRGTVHRPR